MPQMSPMNWLLTILMTLMLLNFFMTQLPKNSTKLNKMITTKLKKSLKW